MALSIVHGLIDKLDNMHDMYGRAGSLFYVLELHHTSGTGGYDGISPCAARTVELFLPDFF
jgi:hypothetical protein